MCKSNEVFINCVKSKITSNLSLELECQFPGFESFLSRDLHLRECQNLTEAKLGFNVSMV